MKREHEIIMVPTGRVEKNVGNIVLPQYGQDLHIFTKNDSREYGLHTVQQLLYLISEDTAGEGDWVYVLGKGIVHLKNYNPETSPYFGCPKIVASTNSELGPPLASVKVQLLDFSGDKESTDLTGEIVTERGKFPTFSEESIESYVDAYNAGKPIRKVMVECVEILGSLDSGFSTFTTGDYKLVLTDNNEAIFSEGEERLYRVTEVNKLLRDFSNTMNLDSGYVTDYIKKNLGGLD